MNLKAGRCGLIVDGTALDEGFACIIELADDATPYGFLAGPTDQLKTAQTAQSVQVDFGHGETAKIQVLQLSGSGIALICVALGKTR